MIIVSFPDFLSDLPLRLQNLMGEFCYVYSDMGLKRWGKELSGNSVHVIHAQLLTCIK